MRKIYKKADKIVESSFYKLHELTGKKKGNIKIGKEYKLKNDNLLRYHELKVDEYLKGSTIKVLSFSEKKVVCETKQKNIIEIYPFLLKKC